MKKLIPFLFAAVFAVGLFFLLPEKADAATSGNYTYEVSNNQVTITRCSTSASGAITIPSSLGGYPVTSIGDSAFSGCTNLTTITIPDSVTSIGNNAFSGCTGLTYNAYDNANYLGNSSNPYLVLVKATTTSVTSCAVHQNTRFVYESAFSSCTSLSSIMIPNSVTSIGDSAFSGCTSLTSITIPNSVTNIGIHAFSGCSSLASVTLGNSVTSIGSSAFSGCSSLASVTLGNSVTSIGSSAFSGCSALTSITIPDSVTFIGQHAFSGCTGLTSITIPDSVTLIGGVPFSGCSNLESITIPFVCRSRKTASDTYQYPFGAIFGTASYTGGVATTQTYYGSSISSTTSSTYYIPSTLKSVTVTGGNILYGAFENCKNLTSITIPKSVTSIGNNAFSGCTGLTSITIPDGVTSIGDRAFDNCTGLTSITIPDSVTSIENYAFSGCKIKNLIIADGSKSVTSTMVVCKSSLKSVIIPDSVTSIGASAFSGCTGLTSVTIPDSVTSIGSSAFSGCYSLKNMTIPFVGGSRKTASDTWQEPFGYIFGTTSYSGGVAATQLYYGSSASSITASTYYIPSTLKSVTVTDGNILYGAFYNCTNLTSITIPDSVTNIGNYAFYNCTRLTSITIPDSVTSIGYGAFSDCSIMNLIIADGSKSVTSTMVVCKNSLNSVTIPDSVTSIGDSAFYNCKCLTSITIPDGVTSIGDYAFSGCPGLTTIPNSVTSIGAYAFSDCTGLTSITIPDSVTTVGSSAFSGCSALKTVAVDSQAAFKALSFTSSLESITLGEHITSISASKFKNCTGLTSVTIGKSVTTIGASAFSGCKALTSVTIPDNVESIGASAFSDCTDLSEIIAGTGIRRIFANAFLNTAAYNRLQNWKNGAFYLGNYLIKVKPETQGAFAVKEGTLCIADSAFSDCTLLSSVTIPNGVESIGASAFSGCSALNALAVPDSVSFVGSAMLQNCTSLKELTLGNGVSSLPSGILSGCSKLQTLTIPFVGESRSPANGAPQIPFGSLFGTSSFTGGVSTSQTYLASNTNETATATYYIPSTLKSVTVTGGEILRGAFQNCKNLTSVSLPEVKTVGAYAFSGCSSLTSFTLPANVETLTEYALSGCNKITEITLPKTLKQIDSNAFNNWSALKKAVYLGSEDEWNQVSIMETGNSALMLAKLYFSNEIVLSVSTMPQKTQYFVGESFDPKGLTLLLTYKDGATETVSAGYELSGFDSSKGGDVTVTVSFEGNSAAFQVHVKKRASSVEIKTLPSKTNYDLGDTLDTAGLALTASYDDGTTEIITEGYTTSGYNLNLAGEQTVTVSFEGKTASFPIKVTQLVLESETKIRFESGAARPGETVEIFVVMENAPELSSASVSSIRFDEERFSLKSVEWLIPDALMTNYDAAGGVGAAAFEAKTVNGRILKITLLCKETAQEGDSSFSAIISVKNKTVEYSVQIVPGTVTVRNALPGDADGDEVVTDADAIYVLMHTFFPDLYPIEDESAFDFDGDGVLTDADAIYLLMYTFFPEMYPIALPPKQTGV